jgi:CrcB protein
LGIILTGGSAGTAIRAWLEAAYATPEGGWPWVTFWINITGSLLLGGLLEALAATGPDRGWRRGMRLGLGTGFLGGFTTYSTFSVETVQLLSAGLWAVELSYGLGSVVLGPTAAFGATRIVRMLLRRPHGTGTR